VRVLSEDETIDAALRGMSLSRYGDGELRLCLGKSAASQSPDPKLQRELKQILAGPTKSLVCIPNPDSRSPKAVNWQGYATKKFMALYGQEQYGSAFITRPDSAPWIDRPDYWTKVEDLWRNKSVTLVVGDGKSITTEQLVKDGANVRVVFTPRQHAYATIDQIEEEIARPAGPILMCVGATATVLAERLAKKDLHAIDLGHIGMFMRKHRGAYSVPLEGLASNDYRKVLNKKHKVTGWGGTGKYWSKDVQRFFKALGAGSILDYGCGAGSLAEALKPLKVQQYDPGVPGREALPKPCDLLVCTDVLEHVEPDRLDVVLQHMYRITNKGAFVVISTRPAREVLPDGRNAHLIVQPSEWWLEKLKEVGWKIEQTEERRGTAIWMRK